MDPLAHSLLGAALARTPLRGSTPYGTATLILAANLPDVDVLAYAGGADVALLMRRGWTHGPLGLLLLPPLLWLSLLAWHRWRTGSSGALPRRHLLVLAYVAALSHPLLDWLNTYGVRLLSPFSDRWFYGDALFIVDPWFWLILAAALFLTSKPSRRADRRWLAAAVVTSLPLLAVPVSLGAKITWLGSLAFLALLRRWGGQLFRRRRELWTGAALLAWMLYLSTMVTGGRIARHQVAAELERRQLDAVGLMVGPLPATPWTRDVVVELADSYRVGRFSWLARPRLRLDESAIDKPGDGASPPSNFVARALEDPSIEGFMNWVRFPYVEVVREGNEVEVFVIDARYLRRQPRGPQDFGATSVRVPAGTEAPGRD